MIWLIGISAKVCSGDCGCTGGVNSCCGCVGETVSELGGWVGKGISGSGAGGASIALSRIYFMFPRRLPGAMWTVNTCHIY